MRSLNIPSSGTGNQPGEQPDELKIFVNNGLNFREGAWIRVTSGDRPAQDFETRSGEVARSRGSATGAHSRHSHLMGELPSRGRPSEAVPARRQIPSPESCFSG